MLRLFVCSKREREREREREIINVLERQYDLREDKVIAMVRVELWVSQTLYSMSQCKILRKQPKAKKKCIDKVA